MVETAVRETEEESGYKVEITGFLGLYQTVFMERQMNVCGPVFLAKVVGGKAQTSEEHPEVCWVTAEEFLDLAATGRFWTKYLPVLMRDYLRRGSYPLDAVSSEKLA